MKNNCGFPNHKNTSVVICCAGIETKLGIGTSKALLDICGEPLIVRQLELLEKYKDIRIVVGFQAEKLIETVNKYRKDIMYVFNYEYDKTGVANSLKKAIIGSKEYVISIDGDTLENPKDFQSFLDCNYECLPVSSKNSFSSCIMATVQNELVTNLSRDYGTHRWSNILKIKSDKLQGNSSYIYEMISSKLPLKAFNMRTRSIETPEDYEQAIEWFRKDCMD